MQRKPGVSSQMGGAKPQMEEEGEEVTPAAPVVPTTNMKIQAAKSAAGMPASTGQMGALNNKGGAPAPAAANPTAASSPTFTTQSLAPTGAAPTPITSAAGIDSKDGRLTAPPGNGDITRRGSVGEPPPPVDTQADLLAAIDALINGDYSGARDTSAEKQTARDLTQQTIGNNSYAVGARMGGQGLSSGYYAKQLEGVNQNAQTALDARLQAIDAASRQEYAQGLTTAGNLYYTNEGNNRSNDAADRARQDWLNQQETVNHETSPNFNDTDNNGTDDFTNLTADQSRTSDYAFTRSSGWTGEGTLGSPKEVPSQDEALIQRMGAQKVGGDATRSVYYDAQTQRYYIVISQGSSDTRGKTYDPDTGAYV